MKTTVRQVAIPEKKETVPQLMLILQRTPRTVALAKLLKEITERYVNRKVA